MAGQKRGARKVDRIGFYSRLVAEHCHDTIIVTGTDGRVEWVNAAFTESTGYSLAEIEGRPPGEILQGRDTDHSVVRKVSDALKARRPIRVEILNYTKSGVPYWVEMHITPVFDGEGRHTHFIAVERDITERRELDERTRKLFDVEEFQKSERRLLGEMSEWLYSAKSLQELLAVVELSMSTLMPEAEGALFIYSEARDTLERVARWGDSGAPDFVSPDECWALRRGRPFNFGTQAIQLPCNHGVGARHPHFCLPIIAQSETIGLLHLSFTAFDVGQPAAFAAHEEFLRQRWNVARTCGEQISLALANVRLRGELEDRSVRDQLTGLWNRRWFLGEGGRLLRRSLHEGRPFSLAAFDVDHFKSFNDRFGHDAGDAVLVEVGDAMRSLCRETAASCRIGGEEFAVLLPDTNTENALRMAEALRARLAAIRIMHEGTELPTLTVSAGIATAPIDGSTIPSLLKTADRALYAAKAAGRDTVVCASEIATMGGEEPAFAAPIGSGMLDANEDVDREPRRARPKRRSGSAG